MAMSASVSGITAHQLQCDNYRCYAYAQFAQEFLAKYHELDQGCEPSQVITAKSHGARIQINDSNHCGRNDSFQY